jgi:UDP-GlcNAc:undecaprenyl-phosphate GlcNAc-1-phosphate transferase
VYSLFYEVAAISAATAVLCLFCRAIADRLQVFDYPRGGRKHHMNPTPQIGGFAILLPVVAWLLAQWLVVPGDPLFLALGLCGAGMGIVGVMDDQSHLSPTGRLLVVGVSTVTAIALDPHLIAPAIHWGAFAPTKLEPWLFVLGAVIATAGFVSSVNMADGINGLVPATFFIWCVGFDVFADGAVREVSLALTGPVLIVLIFNLRGVVFLGDCGTFGVGFLFALMALACLREGKPAAETLLVWFFVPVLDCIRVIAARLVRGRSPLRGGKDHFHHILADVFGKRRAMYVYTATILVTSTLAALVPHSGIYILIALSASSLGFLVARRAMHRRREGILQPAAAQAVAFRRAARKRIVDG